VSAGARRSLGASASTARKAHFAPLTYGSRRLRFAFINRLRPLSEPKTSASRLNPLLRSTAHNRAIQCTGFSTQHGPQPTSPASSQAVSWSQSCWWRSCSIASGHDCANKKKPGCRGDWVRWLPRGYLTTYGRSLPHRLRVTLRKRVAHDKSSCCVRRNRSRDPPFAARAAFVKTTWSKPHARNGEILQQVEGLWFHHVTGADVFVHASSVESSGIAMYIAMYVYRSD